MKAGRSKPVSRDQVFAAIEKITASGGEITYASVLEELGSGSKSTVGKYLKEWKESQQPDWQPRVPEGLEQSAHSFICELWSEATKLYDADLSLVRDRMNSVEKSLTNDLEYSLRKLDEAEIQVEELESKNDLLQADMLTLHAKCAGLESALVAAKEENENLRQENRKHHADIIRATELMTRTEIELAQLKGS
ncbi:MAG: DNA-binding protein [Candidatus Thiodiazotropha sp.]